MAKLTKEQELVLVRKTKHIGNYGRNYKTSPF